MSMLRRPIELTEGMRARRQYAPTTPAEAARISARIAGDELFNPGMTGAESRLAEVLGGLPGTRPGPYDFHEALTGRPAPAAPAGPPEQFYGDLLDRYHHIFGPVRDFFRQELGAAGRPNPVARLAAQEALGKLGPEARAVLPHLADALRGGGEAQAQALARLEGQFGDRAVQQAVEFQRRYGRHLAPAPATAAPGAPTVSRFTPPAPAGPPPTPTAPAVPNVPGPPPAPAAAAAPEFRTLGGDKVLSPAQMEARINAASKPVFGPGYDPAQQAAMASRAAANVPAPRAPSAPYSIAAPAVHPTPRPPAGPFTLTGPITPPMDALRTWYQAHGEELPGTGRVAGEPMAGPESAALDRRLGELNPARPTPTAPPNARGSVESVRPTPGRGFSIVRPGPAGPARALPGPPPGPGLPQLPHLPPTPPAIPLPPPPQPRPGPFFESRPLAPGEPITPAPAVSTAARNPRGATVSSRPAAPGATVPVPSAAPGLAGPVARKAAGKSVLPFVGPPRPPIGPIANEALYATPTPAAPPGPAADVAAGAAEAAEAAAPGAARRVGGAVGGALGKIPGVGLAGRGLAGYASIARHPLFLPALAAADPEGAATMAGQALKHPEGIIPGVVGGVAHAAGDLGRGNIVPAAELSGLPTLFRGVGDAGAQYGQAARQAIREGPQAAARDFAGNFRLGLDYLGRKFRDPDASMTAIGSAMAADRGKGLNPAAQAQLNAERGLAAMASNPANRAGLTPGTGPGAGPPMPYQGQLVPIPPGPGYGTPAPPTPPAAPGLPGDMTRVLERLAGQVAAPLPLAQTRSSAFEIHPGFRSEMQLPFDSAPHPVPLGAAPDHLTGMIEAGNRADQATNAARLGQRDTLAHLATGLAGAQAQAMHGQAALMDAQTQRDMLSDPAKLGAFMLSRGIDPAVINRFMQSGGKPWGLPRGTPINQETLESHLQGSHAHLAPLLTEPGLSPLDVAERGEQYGAFTQPGSDQGQVVAQILRRRFPEAAARAAMRPGFSAAAGLESPARARARARLEQIYGQQL